MHKRESESCTNQTQSLEADGVFPLTSSCLEQDLTEEVFTFIGHLGLILEHVSKW